MLLMGLGIFGLFLIALIDSAGVPTSGGPDLLLLLLVIHLQDPTDWLQLALAAVTGSALGCVAFYYVGLRGGGPILERVAPEKQASIKATLDRWGLWAVGVAMLGPPPYPTKLVVVSAGFFQMRLGPFLTGVVLGRVLRYGAVGYLAMRFGAPAKNLLAEHYPAAFLILISAVCLGLLVGWRWRLSTR